MSSEDRQFEKRQLSNPQGDSWDTCPTGELTKMVHRLDAAQRRSQRTQVFRTALVSAGVFACVVFALGSMVGTGGTQYGGINCSYCRDHMAEYQPHAAGELVLPDAEFVAGMKTHLEKCTLCRGKFQAMYPDLLTASSAATKPTLEFALQPMFAVGQLLIQQIQPIQRSW